MDNTLRMRVKKFLEFSKISHADFARRAGVTPAYVANIRQNLTVPVIQVLKDINKNLSLDWLLLGAGEMLAVMPSDLSDAAASHAAELAALKADFEETVKKQADKIEDLKEKLALYKRIVDLEKQVTNG